MSALKIRRERVVLPSLVKELDGYSILHVSDIHFDNAVKKDRILWEELHRNKADLILVTGDFITHDSNIEPLCEFLGGSEARDGIYGILGNHDYYYRTLWQHFRHSILGREFPTNDWKKLVHALYKVGVKVLINDYVTIKSTSGPTIFIEGTDDPVLGRPQISEATPDYHDSDLKILMSHSPDILYWHEVRKKRFDILLSGHTHGGQIRFPWIGPLMTGTHYAKKNETFGMYKALDMTVNVSAGIGFSLMPIRINCPAEVIHLEMTRSPR
jgi:predicted MPP superfamily phosphohydrolase